MKEREEGERDRFFFILGNQYMITVNKNLRHSENIEEIKI